MSLSDLVFAHDVNVSQIISFLSLGRSDHAVILLKFMVEMACQTVALAAPNTWKAGIRAINFAASGENWTID